MKKYFYAMMCALVVLVSCDDDKEEVIQTYPVTIQLTYPEGSGLPVIAGIAVSLTNESGSVYESNTDGEGKASFVVPGGIYEAAATDKRSAAGRPIRSRSISATRHTTAPMTSRSIPIRLITPLRRR